MKKVRPIDAALGNDGGDVDDDVHDDVHDDNVDADSHDSHDDVDDAQEHRLSVKYKHSGQHHRFASTLS